MKSYPCQFNMENYLTKLIEWGIPEDFLDDLDLDLESLYKKLCLSSTRENFLLRVEHEWQIKALSGNLAYYEEFEDANLFKDNLGAGIAHYAAWSGNTDALTFVMSTYPDCLEWKVNSAEFFEYLDINKAMLSNTYSSFVQAKAMMPWTLLESAYGRTIAHYAAMSNSISMMDCIEKKHLEYLEQGDYVDNSNPAFYAVSSNALNILDWINAMRPHMLTKKDINGRTIAHYATYHGLYDVLDWLQDNQPDLLDEGDWYGLTIAQSATKSGDPAMLNHVLSLSLYPDTLILQLSKSNTNPMSLTLLKALETNFILTSVQYQGERVPSDKILPEITLLLDRNKLIHQVKMGVTELMCIMKAVTSINVGDDICLHILGHMIPDFVNIIRLHQDILLELKPKQRAIHLVENEIARLFPMKETQNKFLGLSLNMVLRNSDKKLIALRELIKLLKSDTGDLASEIQQWENQHSQVVEESSNKVKDFFCSVNSFFTSQRTPEDETMQCIMKVKKLFSIELDTQPVLKMNAQS